MLRNFLKSVVGVFLVIALVVVLFTSVENVRRLGDTEAKFTDILWITLLQAPETLYQVMPLVLMLASLLTFLRLARTSELVIIRASGVSALRLIAVPMVASLLVGAIAIVAINPFVAASMKQGEEMEDGFRDNRDSLLSFSREGIWLRQADTIGQTVIQAGRTNANGTRLSGVRLYRFDGEGTLYSRVDAAGANLIPGVWRLSDATLWELDNEGRYELISTDAPLDIPTDLTNEQILESFAPPQMISLWNLGSFIAQMEDSGFSGRRHRLYLQTELAKPALFAAMVLIGAAFSLRPARFGQAGIMILLAVLAGFSLYFLKDFAESLGAQGQVPLAVAAWTPPVAAILLALSLLLHLEDG